jgi:hypothetical protein
MTSLTPQVTTRLAVLITENAEQRVVLNM